LVAALGAKHAVVVGAGVAGVSAALTLSECGWWVLIIDREESPFMRQIETRGRWLDPYFYDWPTSSYAEEYFPVVEGVPLCYRHGWAHEIAATWYNLLLVKRNAHPLPSLKAIDLDPSPLKWSPSTSLPKDGVTLYEDNDEIGLQLERRDSDGTIANEPPISCSLLVVTGFVENQKINGIPDFMSPPYWHRERDNWLTKRNQSGPGPQRVLIVGGADGATQDFLRIMTGLDDHRELLGAVETCFGPALEARRRQLVVHDQGFWRGYAWAASAEDEKSYHVALDEAHRRYAEALLSDPAARSRWYEKVQSWHTQQRWATLGLFVREEHLNSLFAFNRFMLRLILGLGDDLKGLNVDIRFGREIVSLEPSGGVGPRRVTLKGGEDAGEWDHVLVRFGLGPPLFPTTLPRRNLLPPHYVPAP
jgi:FAD binding domain